MAKPSHWPSPESSAMPNKEQPSSGIDVMMMVLAMMVMD